MANKKESTRRSKSKQTYADEYKAIPTYEPNSSRASLSRDKRRQKRAASVKTQNERDQIRRLRLQLKGVDPDEHTPSFWEKLAEERLYTQLYTAGFSYEKIDGYQKKRVFSSLAFILVGLILGVVFHPWLMIGGLLSGVAKYMAALRKADAYYKSWRFARQLSFSKFTRLVIPYLKASNGRSSLYGVFSKVVNRLENEEDRIFLERLMYEINDKPNDIQPFLDYAERTSGTDMSYLFMSTIFDYQQSTSDMSVIDELGKLASEDMLYAVDEIISFKINRFELFPTKVVMSSFILVVGVAAGIMLESFQDFNGSTGGGMLDGNISESMDNPLVQQGEAWLNSEEGE